MITELQQAQLDAFDETIALLPPDKGWLTRVGKKARVIAAPFRNSRLLQEAGYNAQNTSSIEIKRADFVQLAVALDDKNLVLDGVTMRVVDINDDPSDALVNVTLKNRN